MTTKTINCSRKTVIASHNAGKVCEITKLLEPLGLGVTSAAELDLPEPLENGQTFSANAIIKATAARDTTNLLSLADDSGLVVPTLNGAPGVYSARWAGPKKDYDVAMERIAKELAGREPAAHFVCALALAWPDGSCEHFEGTIHGTLVFPPRGINGFGYDPIFFIPELGRTMAELRFEEKNQISHRFNAAQQALKILTKPQS
mgnify:CR=1 FL=1